MNGNNRNDFLKCRIDTETKNKFKVIATMVRGNTSDMLRDLVVQYIKDWEKQNHVSEWKNGMPLINFKGSNPTNNNQ